MQARRIRADIECDSQRGDKCDWACHPGGASFGRSATTQVRAVERVLARAEGVLSRACCDARGCSFAAQSAHRSLGAGCAARRHRGGRRAASLRARYPNIRDEIAPFDLARSHIGPIQMRWGCGSMQQLGLTFSKSGLVGSRGRARVGAGRKRLPAGKRHTSHRARPKHRATHPVHVTLRADVRSLRSQQVVRTVLGALRDSHREGFRIAHYSVQDNHLHLIVEARDTALLSSAVRGLAIRVALRVNRLLFRRGRFWADRWHGHTLKTPREVRNALRYVLQNHRKHGVSLSPGMGRPSLALDPLSSAEWFDGFADPLPFRFRSTGPPCIALPTTWLLRTGWRRHGLSRISESPLS